MKKRLKVISAIVVCVSILFTILAIPSFADAKTNSQNESISVEEYVASSNASAEISKPFLAKLINKLSNFFLNDVVLEVISKIVPRTSKSINAEDFDIDTFENFYAGTDEFEDTAAQGAVWQLGYSQKSILPHDFGTAAKYARGSYVPWWYSTEAYKDEDGNEEQLKVRTIVMSDGNGEKVAFCVLDCIGIANGDVRQIRAAVADYAAENNIVSINVSASHTHTGLDTQGTWTKPISAAVNNIISATGLTEPKSGVDETLMKTIIERTALSIREATESMTDGELTYAVGDISGYTHDRTPPYVLDNRIYRLTFEPYDDTKTPTIISTFGCHPESASYDWLRNDDGVRTISTKVTGDFVYYMEKVINNAGYNFIYIQGDVGTITSARSKSDDGISGLTCHDTAMRYGYEMGYITLGLSMTEAECAVLNDKCGDLLGIAEYGNLEKYTIWYKGRTPVADEVVAPILNLRMEQFTIEIENNVSKILTKSAIVDNTLIYDKNDKKYYTASEIGYMEIGDVDDTDSSLKVFLCPGETFCELVVGGDCLEGFKYKSLRELYGDNIIACDLMNDAVGYIEPDNYYVIAGYQYDEANDSLESDTWCMVVSLGKNTASTIIGKFIDLVDSVA